MLPAVLISLLAFPAAAQPAAADLRARYGYEEVVVLAWNEACSIGIRHYRYPGSVEGAPVDPMWGRLGAVSLDPGETRAKVNWLLQVKPGYAYYKGYQTAAEDQLNRGGYTRNGFVERVRTEPVASGRGLESLIKSTASLEVGYNVAYASAPHALSRVYYSPLGTCAFLVFERPGIPPDLFKYQLVRVPVETRRKRAEAHITNALLLYKKDGDLYGALEEAEIAAGMDPRLAEARYRYAALLSAHGRFEEALKELREAVTLERSYAKTARAAIEFEDLWKQPRFKQAIAVADGTMPLKPR